MQKNGTEVKIGSYELELFVEETKKAYEKMPRYEGEDVLTRFFCHLLSKGEKESLVFLEGLGIDPEKLFFSRPLSEPDENGEILYLCFARLAGRLLKGGDTKPRQSEEAAGLSMVFVGDEREFTQGPLPLSDPQVELRFVIPLPFDGAFFENLQ